MAANSIDPTLRVAIAHHEAKRFTEAEQAYRQVLELAPQHADALHRLGVLTGQTGNAPVAVQFISRSVQIDPQNADAWASLGLALLYVNRPDAAADALRRAIELRPDFADAYNSLGNALGRLGDREASHDAYAAAVRFRPAFPMAHANLGRTLASMHRLDDAVAHLEQAILLRPQNAGFHADLANMLCDRRDTARAITEAREALRLAPQVARHHEVLSKILMTTDDLDGALAAQQQCVRLSPRDAMMMNNLALLLANLGRVDEAIACYDEAMQVLPGSAMIHSNRLCAMHYSTRFTLDEIFTHHREWNQRHAVPVADRVVPWAGDREPGRRLRIGYLSPDLREHAVGRFMLPLMENHDHSSFEVFSYANLPYADAFTERFRAASDGWRDVRGVDDDGVAEQIRADRIDVLVDLAGHTPGNRLLVMARRPAPVQFTYCGYPDTTGLSTIGYRLTDARADPQGIADTIHTEKLMRIPDGNWVYPPDAFAPGLVPPPSRINGYVTFGSFNYLPKLSDEVLQLWGQLLATVPGSRLLVKARALASESARERVMSVICQGGGEARRVKLMPFVASQEAHLATYNQVDIAVDSYPYNGTMTTCEACWMGVPVVTLSGRAHVSRVGASLLSRVGLEDLIATTPQQYVSLAASLANDGERLQQLRLGLRERMRLSPLCNGMRFARQVEAAYRTAWTQFCQSGT